MTLLLKANREGRTAADLRVCDGGSLRSRETKDREEVSGCCMDTWWCASCMGGGEVDERTEVDVR